MSTHRKKILMLTTQLGYGGSETSFIRLANYLSQTMEVTVSLFTRDYGAGAYACGHEPLHANIILLDEGAPTHRVRRWWRRIHRLRALKQTHDACISFLSGPNLVNVLAGVNRRSIVSLRGSRHYDPVAPYAQKQMFQYLFDPLIFRLAARIVPVSAGLQQEVQAAAGKRALAKVRVISPFIDPEAISAHLAEAVPAAYAMLRGQPVIVAVGRLSVEKGFQHLISVFATLTTQQPGVKLLLVGDGPMLQQLRAQCSALTMVMDDATPDISSVLFAGYQKNPLPLMALGHVYVMSSATEGFPNVVLEAMMAGLRVLAADTPWGARAILRRDDDGTAFAYPTMKATPVEYGTLMPRIDQAQHEAAWVEALQQGLAAPRGDDAACARPLDFTMDKVGAKWRALLTELEVKS